MSTLAKRQRKGSTRRRKLNIAASVFVIAVVATALLAFANSILGINPPGLGQVQSANTLANMEPPLCKQHGISPTNLYFASPPAGSTTSDLILGTNGGNNLNGRGGNDTS